MLVRGMALWQVMEGKIEEKQGKTRRKHRKMEQERSKGANLMGQDS